MFLVRTAETSFGTVSAVAALAHLREMEGAGRHPIVRTVGGRKVSATELETQIKAARAFAPVGRR